MRILATEKQYHFAAPLLSVYMNLEVWADYIEYGADNAHGFDMSFAEWCGIEPFRRDQQLVWC
ncbi:hypothetical protein [Bradyrhizobium sp.]|uniref:hypothetical protein n=1 Tax=Bradyrhizobium sp. TaxID=376 RepID=UPI003C659582